MAYLGSVPAPIPTNFQTVNAQAFNGDGSTVAFTLSRPVAATKDIEVLVNNVQQNPYLGSYSVSGTTLTFTEAPTSGSSNIYVIYRDHPLTTIVPSDASVTSIKIADGAVTPEKTTGFATVATSGSASDLSGLSSVATSGDYDDLSNKPAPFTTGKAIAMSIVFGG